MAGVVQQGTHRCVPNRVSMTDGSGWALLSVGMRGSGLRSLWGASGIAHHAAGRCQRLPAGGTLAPPEQRIDA